MTDHPPPEPTGWDMVTGLDLARIEQRHISMRDLLHLVAEASELQPDGLKKPSKPRPGDRARHISWPRAAFCHMAANTGHSYPAIGRFLGGFDHTSILFAAEAHANRMERGLVDAMGRETGLQQIEDRP